MLILISTYYSNGFFPPPGSGRERKPARARLLFHGRGVTSAGGGRPPHPRCRRPRN